MTRQNFIRNFYPEIYQNWPNVMFDDDRSQTDVIFT